MLVELMVERRSCYGVTHHGIAELTHFHCQSLCLVMSSVCCSFLSSTAGCRVQLKFSFFIAQVVFDWRLYSALMWKLFVIAGYQDGYMVCSSFRTLNVLSDWYSINSKVLHWLHRCLWMCYLGLESAVLINYLQKSFFWKVAKTCGKDMSHNGRV